MAHGTRVSDWRVHDVFLSTLYVIQKTVCIHWLMRVSSLYDNPVTSAIGRLSAATFEALICVRQTCSEHAGGVCPQIFLSSSSSATVSFVWCTGSVTAALNFQLVTPRLWNSGQYCNPGIDARTKVDIARFKASKFAAAQAVTEATEIPIGNGTMFSVLISSSPVEGYSFILILPLGTNVFLWRKHFSISRLSRTSRN